MNRWNGLFAMGAALTWTACSMPLAASPPDMTFTVDRFAQGMAGAECDGVAVRCGVPVATCVAKRQGFWSAQAAQRSGRTFAAGRAQGCIDAWRAAYSDGVLTAAEIDPTKAGSAADLCERVYQGPIADHRPCAIDYDCADDGAICDEVGVFAPTSPRVCAQPMPKQKGDGCANAGDVCGTATFCALQTGLATCVAKRASGETCGDSAPCGENLRCMNGLCADRAMAGQACTGTGDCAADAPMCITVSDGLRCLASLTFGTGAPSCQPYGL